MKNPPPSLAISHRRFDAVIFDLDGVITDTARIHSTAWKRLFDNYLAERARRRGGTHKPFDMNTDYRRYVDGKPRYEGVRSFLKSRNIELPYGDPKDSPDQETICGLGNKKNPMFLEGIKTQGVDVYDSSLGLIDKLKEAGIKTAVVSSSKNCAAILEAAEITDLFDVKVDGVDAAQRKLEGKPAPDTFLEATRELGVTPERSVIVEDAISGVQAGRRGNFGCVIGIDRTGHPDDLKNNGADVVVSDLAEVEVSDSNPGIDSSNTQLPSANAQFADIARRLQNKQLAIFLDYDGTLTPIVERPELAILSDDMRATVKRLASLCTVAIISGRDRPDVEKLVGVEGLFYAGSHGFDIAGPAGRRVENQQDLNFLPILETAEGRLREQLADIQGSLVERKKFSIAVHYRLVADTEAAAVERVVDEVVEQTPGIKKTYGKKVYDLQPNIDWNKGKAVFWLLKALNLEEPGVLPLFIGDDVTDEDAFKALKDIGIGIVVMENARPSAAHYQVRDPAEVGVFFQWLIDLLGGEA